MNKTILALGVAAVLSTIQPTVAFADCAPGLVQQGFVCVQDGEYINIDPEDFQGPQGEQGVPGESSNLENYMTHEDYQQFSLERAQELNKIDDRLSAGVASASAMAQHHFDPYYDGIQISIGAAHFRGQQAGSIAIGGPLGKDVFLNVSAARNNKHDDNLGVGLTWRP